MGVQEPFTVGVLSYIPGNEAAVPRLFHPYAGAERRSAVVRAVEQRGLRRRPREAYAWVLLNDELVRCGLLDLTTEGARLVSRYTPIFQTSFILYLQPNRKNRRLCRVIWRRGKECGIAFDA
jgi:hypothetical protein